MRQLLSPGQRPVNWLATARPTRTPFFNLRATGTEGKDRKYVSPTRNFPLGFWVRSRSVPCGVSLAYPARNLLTVDVTS